MGGPFDAIDWTVPWLAADAARGGAWQQAARHGEAAWRERASADARALGLVSGRGHALRFVEQSELPEGVAYERHIAATGGVPTRHVLHDFFNALIWCAFPRSKAALNARQADEIDALGVGATRGRTRDALTLFDENAVIFATADAGLAAALRDFDWTTLMLAQRAAWGRRCEAWAFGHALLEKLVQPYKACTAHAWIVEVDAAYFALPPLERRAVLDARVAADVTVTPWSSSRFAPLPVLGVPGWWPGNADPAFYDDRAVFRSGRRTRGAGAS
jgi:hypothetical protein